MLEFAIAGFWGLIGGLIRVVISGSFVWPRRRSADSDEPGFEFGSLGVILAGGAAGAVLWALAIYPYYADQGFSVWPSAATVLAGVGGGDALLNYFNRQYGVAINQEANQETGNIAESQARSIETVGQLLADCQERERKLREEVDKLKQGGTFDNQ